MTKKNHIFCANPAHNSIIRFFNVVAFKLDDFHCEFHHRSTNVFVHWTELCHYVANTTAKDAFIVNEEGDFLSLFFLILYTQFFFFLLLCSFPLLNDVELNECEENNETTDYRKLFLYVNTYTHARATSSHARNELEK